MLRYADLPGCPLQDRRHTGPVSRSLRALLVALLSLIWLAPAAVAQEEGVFVDPDSPTGKEYAIPLDSARRQADPSDGSAGAAPGSAPLFGAGIVRAGGGSGAGSETGGSAGGNGSEKSAESAASAETAAVLRAATQTPGAPSGGLGTRAIVVLLAAGLLVTGGLAGVVVKRTRG
jgi:hypothetical protein